MEGDALRAIEGQLENEVGEDWASDREVLAGRNAVRREHGLAALGEPENIPASAPTGKRSLWRRLRGW